MENNGEILLYKNPEGKIKIDVRLEQDTVWLMQSQLCELFNKSKTTISEHIKHIFEERELVENSVVRNFRTTAQDGKSYNTNYYNLGIIISVGYRVKSQQGTQFRIWATQCLKEHIIKGFTLNDEVLQNKRAEYRKQIVAPLIRRLSESHFLKTLFYILNLNRIINSMTKQTLLHYFFCIIFFFNLKYIILTF